jgi:hypothetical protein
MSSSASQTAFVHVGQRFAAREAGVVDEDVGDPGRVEKLGDAAVRGFCVTQVEGGAVADLQIAREFVRAVERAYSCAGREESGNQRPANAAAGAGQEGMVAGQIDHAATFRGHSSRAS